MVITMNERKRRAAESRRVNPVLASLNFMLGCAGSILIGLASGPAIAAPLTEESLETLVANSEVIVRGEVLSSRSYWKNMTYEYSSGEVSQSRDIVTDFEIRVAEVLMGDGVGSEFTITSTGGRVGTKGMWDSVSFSAPIGANLTVFVHYDESNKIWRPYISVHGVFLNVKQEDEYYLVRLDKIQSFTPYQANVTISPHPLEQKQEEMTLSNLRKILEGDRH